MGVTLSGHPLYNNECNLITYTKEMEQSSTVASLQCLHVVVKNEKMSHQENAWNCEKWDDNESM